MLDRTRKTFNAAGHAYQRTHDYVRHTRHFVRRLGAGVSGRRHPFALSANEVHLEMVRRWGAQTGFCYR